MKRGLSMGENTLHAYQIKAIDSIINALDRCQKHIVVEMVTGSGKSAVLIKTLELLVK